MLSSVPHSMNSLTINELDTLRIIQQNYREQRNRGMLGKKATASYQVPEGQKVTRTSLQNNSQRLWGET